ncbi:MAG: hypothetical protein ACQEQ4_09705 [Fibrobacterota bacterium]
MYFLSALVWFLCAYSVVFSAPHVNERFELLQPDKTPMPVIVNGDEFYQRVEDLHGRTLVRDEDGWLSYASLNDDSTRLIPGARYTDTTQKPSPGDELHIDVKPAERKRRIREARNDLHGEDSHGDEAADSVFTAGVMVFFDDERGCAEGDNAQEVSQLIADSLLPDDSLLWLGVFCAPHSRSYYDDPHIPLGTRARELTREVLDDVFSDSFGAEIETEHRGDSLSLNIFPVLPSDSGPEGGLQPHSGNKVGWSSPAEKVFVDAYTIIPAHISSDAVRP